MSGRQLLFELEALSVRLRAATSEKALLDGISFAIGAGEVVGLIGPSGAGKSLIARAVLGLLPVDHFLISWQRFALRGEAVAPGSEAARRLRGAKIALVFQEPLAALNPVLPVGTQIAEVLIRHRHAERRRAWRDAIDWLARMQIPEPERAARRLPHQLSGGQRQRVALAQALAPAPDLIIADEPTSALDPLLAEELTRLLVSEVRARNAGLLLVSHDLPSLARHADRLHVLDAGRIVESGSPRALFATPLHEATRRAVAASVLVQPPPARRGSTSHSEAPLLAIEKLVVEVPASAFGKARTILRGIELELRRGGVLGLIGPSGSGKSTLARAILGLLPAKSGTIRIDGHELTGRASARWRPVRRKIQIVFQDPWASLDPRMRVDEIVGEGLRLHRLADTTQRRRALAAEALRWVGLDEDFLSRYPHQLSGGQRQRVAIARALALEPELLLLDEAVSALDARLKLEILELLANLRERFGLSMVFISHDLAAIVRIADQLAVMSEGVIVERGETAELLAAPTHSLTRRLIAAARLA